MKLLIQLHILKLLFKNVIYLNLVELKYFQIILYITIFLKIMIYIERKL